MEEQEATKMNWAMAQDTTFSVDLIPVAKQQLQFLAAVDSAQKLYNGPALDQAIYRYKNCWLPLLEKHMNCPVFAGPLVVPLDCEWIWHCHRLNPIQYKQDCEKIFGKILENSNVVSTVGKSCSKKTESLWKRIYVTEPYNLDLASVESDQRLTEGPDVKARRDIAIEYDLVDAVKRQSSFFSKVSEMMNYDDRFFEDTLARYKAFIHLIKTSAERRLNPFGVPTHDIDLMWHSHQLYPAAYCKDMKAMLGKVLDHNDRDSRSPKGKKLMQLRFAQTQKLWKDMYNNMYCIEEEEDALPKGTSKDQTVYQLATCWECTFCKWCSSSM